MKLWYRIVAFSIVAFTVWSSMGTAAPDAPPPLEWDLQVGQVIQPSGVGPCNTDNIGAGMTTDLAGNVYSVASCHVSSTNWDLVVVKVSPSGAKLWEFGQSCGTDPCFAYGLAADSAGYLGLGFYDPTATPTVKARFIIFDTANGGTVCQTGGQGVTFPDGFTNDIGSPVSHSIARSVIAYRYPVAGNVTTVYAIGGPAGIETVTHYSVNKCKQLWTTSAAHGEFGLGERNPFTNLFGATSLVGGTTSTLKLINSTTGTTVATNTLGGSSFLNVFMNNATGTRLWSTKETTNDVNILEVNSLTAVTTRGAFAPTESKVNVAGSNRNSRVNSAEGVWVDGSSSVFACGDYDDAVSGQSRSFVAKYNTTQLSGMRWNVTWSYDPSASSQHSADCEIGAAGALYALSDVSATDAAQNAVHVRKYSNAGNPRARDAPYVIPGGATPTPAVGNSDAATGFKNFCLFNGFTSSASKFFCGLVYVMSGTFLVGAIAQRVTDRKATMISAGIAALCLMIFVVLIELWDSGTTVLLIILASAFIVWVARNMFIQRGTG